MPTVRIPLVGSLTNRNLYVIDSTWGTVDQRFENCYPEVVTNPIQGQRRTWLYKRLGTLHSATAGAGYTAMEGGAVWTSGSGGVNGVMSFLSGTTLKLYKTSSAAVIGTSIANISTPGALIAETLISDVPNLTILAFKSTDGYVHAWFYPDGGSFTEITSGNYPSNQSPQLYTVGDAAHMDGYMFVMDANGNIWNSDLNSLANWTATSKLPANAYADGGAGVCRYGNYIVGFGLASIEFLRNVGNPSGSPLARVAGVNGIGCLSKNAQRAYLNVGGDVYFIGIETSPGRQGFFKLNDTGYPAKVSTPAIDRYLTANGSARIAGAFNMHGMVHILLYSGAGTGSQPCYCVDTNTWWYMKASTGQNYWNCALGVSGAAYFTAPVSAQGIYRALPSGATYQDDSTAYTATIQTSLIDFGNNRRKFFKSLELIGDLQTTSGNTAISWSDNDYQSFGTAVNVDMATARPRISRLGMAQRRSFKITDAINRPFRLEAMEIEYEEGKS